MSNEKSEKKSDILTVVDRGESISEIEPLLISHHSIQSKGLMDLALELSMKSAGFRQSLPLSIQAPLVRLVRSMNCYYSNLIEGHNTHPIDIERALKSEYGSDKKKRDLQKEAVAHIKVQEWIDDGGISKNNIFSFRTVCEIHKRFCDLLPEDLLWVEDFNTQKKIKVIPGALRDRDVRVGRHIPLSSGALPRFFSRFESVYSALGKMDSILALAASHHRLLWIHPFLDGNGRVARLLSHAATLQMLDTGGMWSISRGLARHVEEYKMHLSNCDLPRRNDLDGRGNLSEEALVDFTRFFLQVCIDQITFMEALMQPSLLHDRILTWAREEIEAGKLPPQSRQILEVILYRNEIPRSEMPEILNVTDRHARRLVSSLIERGIIISDTPKSPFKLSFPAGLAERWMPGLFPVI